MWRRRSESPLVSAVITCFNHETYARACLDSVTAQTYPNVEIIVVDDHSTDTSLDVIHTWIEETRTEATVISHTENLGVCRSRNDALDAAKGDYVSGLSTDDQWLPDKLSRLVAKMSRCPEQVGVAYSDAYLMDATGFQLPGLFIERTMVLERVPEGDIFEDLLPSNFIPAMATLVRRECLEEVGGYDESLVYEDWDMWLRLSRRYHFAFVTQPTARYRILPNSLIQVLHGERRVEFFESTLRLMSKHFDAGPRARAVMRHRMRELGWSLELLEQREYLEFARRIEALDGPAVLP
jgi:glycosyltransferase involved in cell wall biosynthesis